MPVQLEIPQLNAVLEQAHKTVHTPGVIVGIAVNDHDYTIVAYGIADVASQRGLVPTDRLRVGSLTKTFTAVAVLHLIEKGELNLSDTVSQWVPAVPYADSITIKHLLRHTSGLFNYTDSQAFFKSVQVVGVPKVWTPLELLAFSTTDNHTFPPGNRWAYSNTNYILLGIILQSITQQPLAQVFRQDIFASLKMTDTFLDGEQVVPGASVPGYGSNPGDPSQFIDISNVMHVSAAWAAGGIVSTAKDLLTFSRALFNDQLLTPASFVQMKDFIAAADPVYPMVNGYGLGLVSMKIAGRPAYGHIGNIPGYSSLMAYLPADEMHLVVLMNQNYTRVESNKVNVEVIAEAILQKG